MATLQQPPAAVYCEGQNFHWLAYALAAGAEALAVAFSLSLEPRARAPGAWGHLLALAFPLAAAVPLATPALVVAAFLRMTTEVTPTEVRVWFGWIPTFRRALSTAGVTRVEVVRYRPLRDYGGWGVRFGRDGERVLNARGDRGVRLHLADGSKLLIGSQRPEALAQAVRDATMRPED